MIYSFQINRNTKADVTVIGGGTAGVFAAIAAARSGANTILVEKNSMLGGTVTVAAVDYPGLFFAWGNQIIDGPCWEAIKRTEALNGASIPPIAHKTERFWEEQITLNRFTYIYVLNEMLKEAGVKVLTNAMISQVIEEDEQLRLFLTDKNGLLEIDTSIAIDATGDANMATIMGYPCEKSKEQQPATLQNRISGYEIGKIQMGDLEKALEKASFTLSQKMTAERLFHFLENHKIEIHTLCSDADTSAGKTKLEYDGISDLMQVVDFFRNVKGLEQLTVDFVAEETGVRESVRIIGEKTITKEEYLEGTFYQDSVCYAFYPIDLHVKDKILVTHLEEGVVPKIPYRALIPKGAKRLLCAGRCVSSDTYANSAVRVQAACMAMGQAAGCAAAFCALEHKEVKDADYERITKMLTKIGAIVPCSERTEGGFR